MTLETLKGVEEIGGFKAVVMDELREKFPDKFEPGGQMNWGWFESTIRPNHFIDIRQDKNSLSFTLQDGPVLQNGVNGCQLTTLVEAALVILGGLHEKHPCDENIATIHAWRKGLDYQKRRTENRERRGVEGTLQD